MNLPIHPSTYLPTYLSIYLPIYISLSIYISIHLSISLSLSFSLSLSLSLFLSLSVCLLIYLPIYLQAWKLSKSARLPQILNLTTSKMKQFCEISSFFERDNIKKKQFCETFFKNGKLSAALTASSKVLRLKRKVDARSYVLHLSRKIILANLQIWCSKTQPFSGNHRPDLLTSLMNMSHCTAPATENAPLQILFKCPTPAIVFFETLQDPHVLLTSDKVAPATRNDIWTSKSGPNPCFLFTFWLQNVLRAITACTFSTSQLLKARSWCALYIFTSTCASRHKGVHFFDIATSKSGPTFGAFCTFSLRHVLRATTACNFSSLIWTDGSAPDTLAGLLFDPPEPQIIGKTQCFATFLPFRAPASSFFWRFLFCHLLSSALLSASSLLCFSSVHIVGSLTSK